MEVLLMRVVGVLLDGLHQSVTPSLHNQLSLLGRHHLLERMRQLVANGGRALDPRRRLEQRDDPIIRIKLTGRPAFDLWRAHAKQQALEQLRLFGIGGLNDIEHILGDVPLVVLGKSLRQKLLCAVEPGLGFTNCRLKLTGSLHEIRDVALHVDASLAFCNGFGQTAKHGAKPGVLLDLIVSNRPSGKQHVFAGLGVTELIDTRFCFLINGEQRNSGGRLLKHGRGDVKAGLGCWCGRPAFSAHLIQLTPGLSLLGRAQCGFAVLF